MENTYEIISQVNDIIGKGLRIVDENEKELMLECNIHEIKFVQVNLLKKLSLLYNKEVTFEFNHHDDATQIFIAFI